MVWKGSFIVAFALTIGGCAAAVGAGIGAAAYAAYDEWDEDGDTFLDRAEFDLGLSEADVFDDWDENDNGLLDNAEWRAGAEDWDEGVELFDDLDLDDNLGLNGDEFAAGLFAEWDTNDDGRITEAEFDAGIELLGSS